MPSLKGLRVLLCEDEILIRMNTADMLQDMGLDVVEAASVAEALAAAKDASADKPFDLLVTDVTLPDGSGIALARSIRNDLPNLPVVFASGHSRLPEAADMRASAILPKPYGEAQLRQCLELILDARGGASTASSEGATP